MVKFYLESCIDGVSGYLEVCMFISLNLMLITARVVLCRRGENAP